VARNSCCFLPMSVSNTFCSRMSLVPACAPRPAEAR
jgi:hypothetical protein